MTNKELLQQAGIHVRRNSGSEKVICPKCSHTRKKKNDPCLSVDIDKGVYNCHNPGCDFNGKVFEKSAYVPKQKEYFKPKFVNNTDLSEPIVKWFQGRGISQKTLISEKVTGGKDYMPQVQAERHTIQFNYFRDGELVNVKFRDGEKNFKMVKDAELIFYGLDDIKTSDWCVIVEGEIDKLSFTEAGVKEVVSVPNGASKGKSNLEYLDNCIGYFDNKQKIIIATDNDEPGIALREELARRLGYERCYKINFKDCKDANDYLKAYGASELFKTINRDNLTEFPIDGVITSDDIWDEVELLFQNGLERGVTTGLLKEFDEMVSFVPGQLMVLTGIPNHGKSPFSLQIMCALSIKYGWKWGLFTPEHKPLSIFIAKVCECVLGKRMRKGVGFTAAEKDQVKEFIAKHFFFIEPEDLSLDNILEKARHLVIRKGIRGLLIDPWNKLEHLQDKGESETNYISRQLDKIIKFNQRNSVFSIVIAHPTKIKKDFKTKLYEIPSLYDISGSSNWFNKPDIGVCFYRNYKTGNSEIYVQKMKYDHLGRQGNCEVKYNVNNSRFVDLYGDWDNSNWLLPKPQEVQLELRTEDRYEIVSPLDDDDMPF